MTDAFSRIVPELRLPLLFVTDHIDRSFHVEGAQEGNFSPLLVLRRTKKQAIVRAGPHDAAALGWLLADADYYSDPKEFDSACRSICASAKLCAARIRAHLAELEEGLSPEELAEVDVVGWQRERASKRDYLGESILAQVTGGVDPLKGS